MKSIILDWAAASGAGPAIAGGKGWHLGRMAQLGVPVPDGFVIAATASKHRLQGEAVPEQVKDMIKDHLARRGWLTCSMAVRSSAPMEDSTKASFAGIHYSSLNVTGLPALLEAVQAVWDSVWSTQAIAYRQRLGLHYDDMSMAVVIMPLIPAIASGIAFTCDPITGRDDQLLINAHWGFGEALVGGNAEGDEYRLQENHIDSSLNLVDRNLGSKKRVTLILQSGGTQLVDTPSERASRFVLNPEQVVEMGLVARDTAYALDYACPRYDIEWVWDGSRFWVVQARPVTAVGHHTYAVLKQQPIYWSRGNTREVLPDPLPALDWGIYRMMVNRMLTRGYELGGYSILAGVQRAGLFHGRLFLNTSVMQWEGFDAFGLAPKAMNSLLGGHQPEITVPHQPFRHRLLHLHCIVRYLKRSILLRRRADEVVRAAREQAELWRNQCFPKDIKQLVQRIRHQITVMRSADDLFFLQGSGGGALFNLMKLLEKHCPGEGYALIAALMAKGNCSETAMQGYELIRLARIASNDPEALAWLRNPDRVGSEWHQRLPEQSPFRQAFANFLKYYGHRAISESYFQHPRWRERPDYLLDIILGFIGTEIEPIFDRQQNIAQRAWKRIRQRVPFWLLPLVCHWVKAATVESNHREAARSALIAYLEAVRYALLELGKRLTRADGLESADDIFHLTEQEIFALGEDHLPALYAAKRASIRRQIIAAWKIEQEPDVIVAEPNNTITCIKNNSPDHHLNAGDEWIGTSVGAGSAVGRICIATTPGDGHVMKHGEILVAPSTDPAWTPLFLKAGGLVMETGGYLSHGAIVAREFGIPAVVNIPGILMRLEEGETIEVDGDHGKVRRVKR